MWRNWEQRLRKLPVIPSPEEVVRSLDCVAKLALCRQLLGMPGAAPATEPPPDYRDRFERLSGEILRQCPACRLGLMLCVETFMPGTQPPVPEDTS